MILTTHCKKKKHKNSQLKDKLSKTNTGKKNLKSQRRIDQWVGRQSQVA